MNDVQQLRELILARDPDWHDRHLLMLPMLDKIENRIVELEKTLDVVNDAWQQERQMVAELS